MYKFLSYFFIFNIKNKYLNVFKYLYYNYNYNYVQNKYDKNFTYKERQSGNEVWLNKNYFKNIYLIVKLFITF